MKALLAAISLLIATPSVAQNNTWITIYNQSFHTVYFVYSQCRDCSGWDGDLLGSQTIPPGYNISVWIPNYTGYCMYSLRAEGDGGAVWNTFINACESSSWTLIN